MKASRGGSRRSACLLAGSSTNSEVLATASEKYGAGRIAENYATVYPVSMFLRVIVAAILILMI